MHTSYSHAEHVPISGASSIITWANIIYKISHTSRHFSETGENLLRLARDTGRKIAGQLIIFNFSALIRINYAKAPKIITISARIVLLKHVFTAKRLREHAVIIKLINFAA